MVHWLLLDLLPVRQIAFILIVGVLLQFGGIDVLGMATDILTGLVSPDWFDGWI
jgi:hypothetical protein